jgi:hypothetical protein
MSWFFETRTRTSEKNGLITATRKFGQWHVVVDGCEQTNPVMGEMWSWAFEVLRRYTGVQPVRSVLMLGLGAGGEVKAIRRFFKGADITVIEHDPEMIALTDELKLYPRDAAPRIVCEDARTALPRLQGAFDLILVDIFKGPEPSPLLTDAAFLASLNRKLANGGFLIVNAYRRLDYLDAIEKAFVRIRRWRFLKNNLGIFGKPESAASFEKGYVPLREWPEFNSAKAIPPFMRPAALDNGTYWRVWPFSFEHYRTDAEPELRPLPADRRTPFRIVMWQRLSRGDMPSGWTAFSDTPQYKVGFVPLAPEYHARWSETMRRQRRKWLEKAHEYEIVSSSYEEFADAYKKGTIPATLKGSVLWEIRMRMKNPETPVSFLLAKRKKDGRAIAGFARMDSASLPITYYLTGFITRGMGHESGMAGLFDRWFSDALSEGLKFADLGNFWKQGDDSTWKGFSVFKARFNPHYFFFPPLLYRFDVFGRFIR